MKKVYSGRICTDEFNFLCLEKDGEYPYQSDNSLALRLMEDVPVGADVFIRYYISDKPITEDQAVEALVIKSLGGILKASYVLLAYSEVTIEEWQEDATVGGHDLISELSSFRGKYCILIIQDGHRLPDPTIPQML